MPRAKRHFLPGYAWHITHRCHKGEFLLKFERDRRDWIGWLFEAKKRYRLHVLDYTVTSNHIHLLVFDNGKRDTIPRSMQLIAGRTAQEFNRRKERKGAFWGDRHFATAVETNQHLIGCLTYIDLNMVRAGAVAHPSEWPTGGYIELQQPRERYSIIDRRALMDFLRIPSDDELCRLHKGWIDEAIARSSLARQSKWTESVAVGSLDFVAAIKHKLGARVKGRRIILPEGTAEEATLREPQTGLE